jgi:large subunit ribosomal protein L33
MAKKKAMAREYVWLQCTETGDLNYRTSINVKGGIPTSSRRASRSTAPASASTRCTRSSGSDRAHPAGLVPRTVGWVTEKFGRQ